MRSRDKPGGSPFTGQAVSGIEAARDCPAASAWNVGRRVPILAPAGGRFSSGRRRVARGSAPGDRNREVLSTDAEPAGGPARSSEEASVTEAERRGRLI